MLARLSYEQLRSGEAEIDGKTVAVGSLSSYNGARTIAELLAQEIRDGDFLLSRPMEPLPREQSMKGLQIRERPAGGGRA